MDTAPSRAAAGATRTVGISYLPILDVARGIAAGYQAQVRVDGPQQLDPQLRAPDDAERDGSLTARAVTLALNAVPTLPTSTFLAVPVPARVAALPGVRAALDARDSLRGIVLDIAGFDGGVPIGDLEFVLAHYRERGALVAVGGQGASQPELTSIVRLKPSILRLGRDWVRGVDRSDSKRSAVEIIGQLASQLDAWILAEGVTTPAELRALASLAVPLVQGPLVGEAREFWPPVDVSATSALPARPARGADAGDGVLRSLLQQAYTARDAVAAASVLPETTGFDVVIVVDDDQRPTSMLEHGGAATWEASDVLVVDVDSPVADAVARAMLRPRAGRFAPLACVDDAGRFVGIVRLERVLAHLTRATRS
ncbi:EAL domain, c-di-GMP-specific phosphodiesterase class I (or its enzymatically inactive variant) [Jatrophihabitans endophyticus]|uniref:EAL domain, c-di-GMP-specific phosphodiesterase class I (Or its enzymatically inactive variant) n=1 Tax=Jatrophihabitans endophyticus TaxID=1206085 RepID=A0A1M5HX24_9ACTN|nr:EAL domain-containing protein [Jatrophihabitans endophyticus]SHG20439.1 EAL domain, c-di-GMP-specific phosphodiesterase class I (or its enzymatically inactive variant) [Jatrophihabitans endophyticus]